MGSKIYKLECNCFKDTLNTQLNEILTNKIIKDKSETSDA